VDEGAVDSRDYDNEQYVRLLRETFAHGSPARSLPTTSPRCSPIPISVRFLFWSLATVRTALL